MGASPGSGAGNTGLDHPATIPNPSVHWTRQYPGLGRQELARRHAAGQPAAPLDFRLPALVYMAGRADAAIGIAGSECTDAIQGGRAG